MEVQDILIQQHQILEHVRILSKESFKLEVLRKVVANSLVHADKIV